LRVSGGGNEKDPARIVNVFALWSWFFSQAAEPRQAPTVQERARTVYIFHQPIVMLQAKFQIMSPNFVMQPDDAVMVAKENWYPAPASAPEGDKG